MPYRPYGRRLSDSELDRLVEFHRNGNLTDAEYADILRGQPEFGMTLLEQIQAEEARANAAAVAAGITNYIRNHMEQEDAMPGVESNVGGEEPQGEQAGLEPILGRSILGNEIPVVDDPEEDADVFAICESCECNIPSEWDAYYSDFDGYVRCESCDYSHREQEEEYQRRANGDYSPYVNGYCSNPINLWAHGTKVAADGGLVPRINRMRTNTRGFMGRKLLMGFELETECSDYYSEAAEWVFNQGNRYVMSGGTKEKREDVFEREVLQDYDYPGFLWLKTDASLEHGFEIVTSPSSLEYYENFFNWDSIAGLARFGNNAWNTGSCGLHIHLNKASFENDKHLWKFIVFMYKNAEQMIQFAGRNSSYASWSREDFLGYYTVDGETVPAHSFMKHAKLQTANPRRYTAVNLQPISTIELRFFRPSLLPSTVLAALQFCDALHVYSNKINTKEVLDGALKWSAFRGWVAESGRWPVLDQRITVRFNEDNSPFARDEHQESSV